MDMPANVLNYEINKKNVKVENALTDHLVELVMDICGNPRGVSQSQQDILFEIALQIYKQRKG